MWLLLLVANNVVSGRLAIIEYVNTVFYLAEDFKSRETDFLAHRKTSTTMIFYSQGSFSVTDDSMGELCICQLLAL